MGRDDFCPSFMCRFFQSGRDNKKVWTNFCPAFFSKELLKRVHNFPLLEQIIDKTTLPKSILKLDSSFYQFHLSNQKHECFSKFMNKCPKTFLRTTATHNLSCNLLVLSFWKCPEYIVVSYTEFLKNPTRRDHFY